MSTRKERLDQLVEHARKVIQDSPQFDRQSIYQELDEQVIKWWGLSQSARKDYVISVAAILKEEFANRDSEIEAKIPKLDANAGLLYNSSASSVSKEKAFMNVFTKLAGPGNDVVVEDKLLIEELLKTAKFADGKEARDYLRKMSREGQIFEKRAGFWSMA